MKEENTNLLKMIARGELPTVNVDFDEKKVNKIIILLGIVLLISLSIPAYILKRK